MSARVPASKPLRPLDIIEAYFMHPCLPPAEIAQRFGCTTEEVIEIWNSRELAFPIRPPRKRTRPPGGIEA